LGPLVVVALPLAGEDAPPELVAAGLPDITDLDLIDDERGEAELRADEHKEGGEGDDEARELRALHELSVEVADAEGEGERQRNSDPQVEPGTTALPDLEGEQDDEDAHGTGHGAR